jgi:hypothetical protein
MAVLVEVLTFLQRETGEPLFGVRAEALDDGISYWAYPYTAGQGCYNLLSMKNFHGVWTGNAPDCSLK